MRCPKCGAEMNRHAEKLVFAAGSGEASDADEVLGGVVEEMYGCPACGHVEARRS